MRACGFHQRCLRAFRRAVRPSSPTACVPHPVSYTSRLLRGALLPPESWRPGPLQNLGSVRKLGCHRISTPSVDPPPSPHRSAQTSVTTLTMCVPATPIRSMSFQSVVCMEPS